MNIAETPLMVLIGTLLAIIALFVIAATFRLPKNFKDQETQRELMRKRYLEFDLSEKDEKAEVTTGRETPSTKDQIHP
jgi:uncharacterized membrane protein